MIKDWIQNNNLSATWISENIFTLADKNYIYIDHKDGVLFNPDFTLIYSEEEIEAIQNEENKIEFQCFSFGGKVYYSKIDSEKIQLKLLKHIGKAEGLSGYPFLGIHGSYELCSGSGLYPNWINKAKWLGIEALGLAEKHTLAGAIKFQNACKKEGIKSIIGETITIKNQSEEYRVKLYVANYEGWRNLLRIHRRLNVDNGSQFVEEEVLLKNTAGLYLVFCSDVKLDVDKASGFKNLYDFKGVFFQYDPVEYKAAQRDLHCLECLKTYLNKFRDSLPLALITDSYYLDKEDSRVRKILSFIGKGQFQYQSEDQHFKSLEEIIEQSITLFTTKGEEFSIDILESALNGTNGIVAGCDFQIPLGEIHLPKYEMTEEEKKQFKTNEDLFWAILEDGLSKIDESKDISKYIERVETEYNVIDKGSFQSYFLILRDIINWCEDNDVMVGTARGSAGGALTAMLMNITKVDPIQYNLLFSRFLNAGRTGQKIKEEIVVINDETEFLLEDKIKVVRGKKEIVVLAKELIENDEIVQKM